jgi:hypothetical protein
MSTNDERIPALGKRARNGCLGTTSPFIWKIQWVPFCWDGGGNRFDGWMRAKRAGAPPCPGRTTVMPNPELFAEGHGRTPKRAGGERAPR